MTNAGWVETNTEALNITASGVILRIAFSGVHKDSVGRLMGNYVHEALKRHHPAAVVLDFLHFEYRFGNDIAGVIQAFICSDSEGKPAIRPAAIVATGITAKSLDSLLRGAKVLDDFGVKIFSDLSLAVEHLRMKLESLIPDTAPHRHN